ncbi:hypothetical protein [Candidatus Ornithobacterium hominis]|uniref:hypothetical protein n=1 Tax=Candidatus Ornithobacterium hominis TaxID=2497989 RepID=UPI00105890DF|nr:hypothetical protein [Candidatus Ornithobacterium hominis]
MLKLNLTIKRDPLVLNENGINILDAKEPVKETISSVLGKNSRDKTLSKRGERLRELVDSLDKTVPNHCEYWINRKFNYQEKDFKKYFR